MVFTLITIWPILTLDNYGGAHDLIPPQVDWMSFDLVINLLRGATITYLRTDGEGVSKKWPILRTTLLIVCVKSYAMNLLPTLLKRPLSHVKKLMERESNSVIKRFLIVLRQF